jgi:uroporphyrinogen-III synthase
MPRALLASLRVLVTRPAGEGADAWAAALRVAGAEPILYPTLVVVAPESWDALDQALAKLDEYDLLIFTSQTTVAVVVGRLPGHRFPPGLRARIAAVGPATEQAIGKAGGKVALIPSDNRQEGLVDLLRPLVSGGRVLLPIAAAGRALLAESLRAAGSVVDVVTAYRTVAKTDNGPPPAFDAAVFASPSALRGYLAGAGRETLAGKVVAVIGATTAEEAQNQGISAVVASRPDIDAIIHALVLTRAQGEP